MKRALLVNFRMYTPFGEIYYQPIYDFFMKQMTKYKDEFDHLYLLDSKWGIGEVPEWVTVIKVDEQIRYYDAYKAVLPQVKEDLVLLMDNDMVIYRKDVIRDAFDKVTPMKHCVLVSIMDTIGTWKSDELKLGNKFCPYFSCTHKNLLMKYLNVEWGPEMPEFETLGRLTKEIVDNEANQGIYEMKDDKNSIYFDGTQDGEKSKDLGFYHIRAGSTPAYLLATKKYGDIKTYDDYLKNQPQREYLRQFAWMYFMGKEDEWFKTEVLDLISKDLSISPFQWLDYMDKFKSYHGLF